MLDTTQPQVDATANQPDIAGGFEQSGNEPEVTDESFMTIRYNKEDMPLSKDAATVYAQKGMNYDKLSARLEEANAKLQEYDEILKQGEGRDNSQEAYDNKASAQARVDGQLGDFMARNPGIDPRRLPKAVLNDWSRGVPLSEAFLLYQAGEYRAQADKLARELEQRDTNAKNSAASMGKPQSKGSARELELSDAVIKNMSPAELDRNHERIWKYLTRSK